MFTSGLPFLAHWVHDLSPFLVQFTENFGIRYYGVAYLLGFLATATLLHVYARKGRSLLPAPQVSDLMVAIVMGVLIGGRLGYFLLYQLHTAAENPFAIFRIWEGGMASHGGFIGVAVALAWFARSRKIAFFHLTDLVVSTAAAGLLLGRIANFINGELWGKASDVPWAVIFSNSGGGSVPRHPSQLYEAALEGLVLLAFLQWRLWKSDAVLKRSGRLTGEFLIGYAIARTVCEIFREPDAELILGLSRGTFYSTFMIAVGIWLVTRAPRSAASPSPS